MELDFDLLPYIVLALCIAAVPVFAFLKKKKKKRPLPPPKKKIQKVDLQLFYGSQTGTAETFARELATEAQDYGVTARAIDLEEFDPEMVLDANSPLSVFLMATYGEGDPTDNAVEFVKWLSDDNAMEGDLAHLKFTVFGLGNRQYEHYNSMGTKTDKELARRGGRSVYAIGYGDDDKDIQADFATWKEDLWPTLCAELNVEYKETDKTKNLAGSKWTVVEHGEGESQAVVNVPNPSTREFDHTHPFEMRVTQNKELFTSDRSCRHIELTSHIPFTYHTGDHLGVLPENPPEYVADVLSRLDLNANQVISIQSSDQNSKPPFTGKLSIGDILSRCVDLTCVVSASTIAHLAPFATDQTEMAKLKLLGSKQGKNDYHKEIAEPMLTLIEVMHLYRSLKLSIVQFIALAPKLQVRYYSISSSHLTTPSSIHLTVAVVTYDKPKNRKHLGVCSTFLQRSTPSVDTLRAFVRKSTFHPPSSPTTPLLLIGPGTGLAPLRGFVLDRLVMSDEGKELGECDLYFGCRYARTEYLYEDELKYAKNRGAISNLETAVSRDTQDKIYVQNLLIRNKKRVWELLSGEKGAHIYICGLVQMSKDVVEALHCVMREEGGLSQEQAVKKWEEIKAQGRFKTDVWT